MAQVRQAGGVAAAPPEAAATRGEGGVAARLGRVGASRAALGRRPEGARGLLHELRAVARSRGSR